MMLKKTKKGMFYKEYGWRALTIAFGLFVIVLTLVIGAFLIYKGSDTFLKFGHSIGEFLGSADWEPVDGSEGGGKTGALIFIAGSLVTCGLALLIATPFALGSAVFMTEISPAFGERFYRPVVEIFAGIPSVVYGWVGLTVLVPAIKTVFHRQVGHSVLAAALVLAVMIFPTITSVSADAIAAVPEECRNAAYGLGSTRWQAIWRVIVPAASSGVITGIILTNGLYERDASIQESMQDAILHENDKIDLFGLPVNPGLISAYLVTGAILLFAAIVRIFVIPRFKRIPGKFQLVLEQAVGFFGGMASNNSPHRNNFLGAYLFAAGAYICIGTLFELVGIPWMTAAGASVSLPAPLSDINGAIMMGCLSYLVILSGGILSNGFRGMGRTLKEFSLPISMSFRLFGALLSGLLVTELVYSYLALSFVLPVVVGVLFTILHALIQTYVLTMLTALFYGEVSEPPVLKPKKQRNRKVPSEVTSK